MERMHEKRVSIVGATGYAGGELAALLARHRGVEWAGMFSGTGGNGSPYSALHPSLAGESGPEVAPFSMDALESGEPEFVFLATPHEVSAEVVPEILESLPATRIVDLSGAFRLPAGDYPRWYGFRHPRPELLPLAVYGLTEWCNGELANARLVANPGCYATAALLALKPVAPLLDAAQTVVCDAKSGASGAGKKADFAWSFTELFGNAKAYSAGTHRHQPEIETHIQPERGTSRALPGQPERGTSRALPGQPERRTSRALPGGDGARLSVCFVPHLLPVPRGILSTLHVAFARPVSAAEIEAAYRGAYAGRRFVRVLPAGELPEMKSAVGTPRADVGFSVLPGGRRAVLVCVLDNLLKGAASQAVQNFNRMAGFAEEEGLT